MKTRNKLKLVWPLLALASLAVMCCACANLVSTVEQVIPVIGAIVGIVGAAGEVVIPAEASLLGEGVVLAQNGLTALVNSLKSYEANKTAAGALASLQAAFTAAQQNLGTLLKAANVKDPVTAQKITAVVQAAVSTIGVVEASVVAQAPAAPTAPAGS